MASIELGPLDVVAVDAAGRYAAWVARERAKGLLCQRGRARGTAAKWAGENKERNLVS